MCDRSEYIDRYRERRNVTEREPLSALDFVQMYLWQTEGHPQNGHYVNAAACRRKWPRKDDTKSRCTRCDAEALIRCGGGDRGE